MFSISARMRKARRFSAHAAACLAAVCFGLMSPMCKVAMAGGAIGPLSLGMMRIAGAAALFWLVSLFLPRERIDWRHDLPMLTGMSLCGMGINQFFYVWGLQYTSPTNACVIATTTPVFTLILSILVLHLVVTRRMVGGVALAAAGALVLILGSGVQGGISGHPFGDALCLVSQFSAACYFVFFGRMVKRYSPVTLMKWLFTISTVLLLPVVAPEMADAPWGEVTVDAAFGAAYVVVFGSFVSYLLLIYGQRHLKPPVVATYNYVQPAVAAAAGVLMGLDVLTWQKIFAVALIAVGVYFVTHLHPRSTGKE